MENQTNILDFTPEHQHPRAFAATTGIRFANFIVDRILGTVLFYFIIIGLASATNFDDANGVISTFLLLFAIATIPGYYIVFEYFWGKTPGKFITKTKVVNESGAQPSFMNIVGRTLCRFIPFEPFSYFSGDRPSGWHDSISKTYVVEDSYISSTNTYV